ncbi:MAG: short chain dehydrogenase [Burkholderiales bacterium RIFCSPLOWO2_12_67_14]|nr:MAG: short chain dehydrogenase [Burkholderiales bacterium RIFCSPLOWO2_02_FULL_67_64]OGB40605.1 MAG: short chain dehydrogenase [Burkholderiales bacterium RIFCSPHIGHO2_12_FULL_67_38]OGB43423.1 MAG: short chain dehydrogenase [Burkholderiales bacterium RIFCSPLOWO2_12_67_14]OGB92952.1 MAG: short chain dehydrogenase [Burkholderiales bacterium RIFCSPLOWO2_12_FULL_67_210]
MSTVLVIGASRGIGLEFVRQYLEAGDRVIATARDDDGLARLRALGAEALRLDVAQPASVSALSWQLDGEKLDVALYVAGIIHRAGATSPPTQQAFDEVMHTNVLGAMQVIPQVLPMVEEAGGVFGALSSGMSQIASVPASDAWLYRVSKAALNMAVSSARFDYPLARLVLLDPGWVQTDMGGDGAPLSVAASVRGLRAVLASVTPEDSGRLIHRDGRRADHW